MARGNEEIQAGEVNLAYRFTNLTNIARAGMGKARTGPMNVLALPTPDSTDDDCVALLG